MWAAFAADPARGSGGSNSVFLTSLLWAVLIRPAAAAELLSREVDDLVLEVCSSGGAMRWRCWIRRGPQRALLLPKLDRARARCWNQAVRYRFEEDRRDFCGHRQARSRSLEHHSGW